MIPADPKLLSAWALRGFFVPFPAPALAWTCGAGGLEGDGAGEDTPAHVLRMGGRFSLRGFTKTARMGYHVVNRRRRGCRSRALRTSKGKDDEDGI